MSGDASASAFLRRHGKVFTMTPRKDGKWCVALAPTWREAWPQGFIPTYKEGRHKEGRKGAATSKAGARGGTAASSSQPPPGLLRCMAEHLHLNPLKCKTVSLFIPHFYKMHGGRSREADMKGMQATAFLQKHASWFFELTARRVENSTHSLKNATDSLSQDRSIAAVRG